MTTKISWFVLIGVILVALLLWLLFYSTLGWFHGHVLVSLSITIVAALFGVVLRWAISEGAVEGVDVVVPVLITGAVSAALALAVTGIVTAPTPAPKGLRETIFVNCTSYFSGVNRPWVGANYLDEIEWITIPSNASLKIEFSGGNSPFATSSLSGTGSVSGSVNRNPSAPTLYRYSGSCNGVPISGTPMIQIPRR